MVAQALAVARGLLAATRRLTTPGGAPLQLVVGLHAGPLMTGVVGKVAPRFCCFGVSVLRGGGGGACAVHCGPIVVGKVAPLRFCCFGVSSARGRPNAAACC